MAPPTVMPRRKPGDPPALVLGAMNFGKRTPAPEAERIVRRALERGVRYYDTANSYNAGESERILGRALGRDRAGVIVSTKAGLGVDPRKREGLSPDAMQRALTESLERLGTEYADIYYLHVPDRDTPVERSLDGMRELVASGRVRSWGISNYASWEILEMNRIAGSIGLATPIVTQLLYSAIHRELDIEYFRFARRYPIHTMTYNALAGGLLTGVHRLEGEPAKGSRFDANAMYRRRYWTGAMFGRVEQVRAVAAAEGCSLVELAYGWVASRPGVDSILVGPATVAHLDQAFDAVTRALSAESCKRLDELAREWVGTDTHYAR
jgi:aryl-alcohol dehydrogenase-like predicted oxidoreductase